MKHSNAVIVGTEQVTPEWLTEVLVESGALETGRVESISFDGGHGNWSSNARLHVHYSQDAAGSRPERLFLKMATTDLEDEWFDDSEVNYYLKDYIDLRVRRWLAAMPGGSRPS